MKILVVGGGGREHALTWSLARSATVYAAPGNPGTALVGTNLVLDTADHSAVVAAIEEHQIDLTVVGPEAPLAAGIVDDLENAGHRAFGPTATAARLEASKAFAKQVMVDAGVPTATTVTFTHEAQALDYVSGHAEPLVVKASGLAAGKGAIVCQSRNDAAGAVREMFGGKFGDAGREVLVEECLVGEELSVLALTNGDKLLLLPASQDHKRIGEGDTGPNTGGMGAYSPVSVATEDLLTRVQNEVLRPTLNRMGELGAPYKGVLYAGIMISPEGDINVLEFNCRFGDPEAQVVLPVADLDLAEQMWCIASGEAWQPAPATCSSAQAAVTTVLAAPGYPGSPVKGATISLPEEPPANTILFHAGTVLDDSGTLKTSGGRVLCATGLGPDVKQAIERSRALAEAVAFEGKVYRTDIGWREVARAGVA